MNFFASTYITGLGKYIETWLKELYTDCKIEVNLDGLILYSTSLNYKPAPFFNNTYLVLSSEKCAGKDFDLDVVKLLTHAKYDLNTVKPYIKNKKSFKILTFDKNQPTHIDYNLLKPIENRISKTLHLTLGQRKHDLDFVLIRRSEGVLLFMLKLTYQRVTEKELDKGTLKPELAYSLCKIANVNQQDVCMDMFCGMGSIPKQLEKSFKYKMIFASDIDNEKIAALKAEYKNNNKNLYIKQRNALDLSYFEDGFIDKVITDPPWNIYNSTGESYEEFYTKFLQELQRILNISGRAVVLMGNTKEFEQALNSCNLEIKETINILVNGKKANIYVLEKIK